MKLHKLFAVTTVFSIMLFAGKAPSSVTVTCGDGGTAPDCSAGRVNFTANGFPRAFEVIADGADLGTFVSVKGGNVDFTLSYTSPGPHNVTLLDANGKDAGTIIDSVDFNIN